MSLAQPSQPNEMVYPSSSAESLTQSLSRLYSNDETDHMNSSGLFSQESSSEDDDDESNDDEMSNAAASSSAAAGRLKTLTIGMIAAQRAKKKPDNFPNGKSDLLPTDMEIAVWTAVAGKIALAEENIDVNSKFLTHSYAVRFIFGWWLC